MTGFLLGLGVSIFLTLISVGCIWFARRLEGATSIGIIQGGMLMKLILGGTLSLAIIKFANVNHWAYALTVGCFVCLAMPVIAFYLVKSDFR